ncbi:hypothetical protein LFUMFP_210056 [Latilactobacillus fuchuensis]|uniref:Uncharacterized protein n=1 Tax=Latilactobacillus fuchuensis TaxID=164393 RepID=A0A2N9DUR6_9LACO|nr:hypothetical protein LFUMFP_210056 [Latilactobacillus fuchuensis]
MSFSSTIPPPSHFLSAVYTEYAKSATQTFYITKKTLQWNY